MNSYRFVRLSVVPRNQVCQWTSGSNSKVKPILNAEQYMDRNALTLNNSQTNHTFSRSCPSSSTIQSVGTHRKSIDLSFVIDHAQITHKRQQK